MRKKYFYENEGGSKIIGSIIYIYIYIYIYEEN